MNNPMPEITASFGIFFVSIGIVIFAIIDGALPIYWKVIIGIMSGFFIVGTVQDLKVKNNTFKKTFANKEDLR